MKTENNYLAELEQFKAKFRALPEFKTRSRAKLETGISYLTGVNHSAKSAHGEQFNIFTAILYLAPGTLSGFNMCPFASAECLEACLNRSGRAKLEALAGLNTIERARVLRTWLYLFNRPYFMGWLAAEIQAYRAKYDRPGNIFAVRLNGTSDIYWERVKNQELTVFEQFPGITFYDYTKVTSRMHSTKSIKNYSLTFSYTGHNKAEALEVLENQGNVAMVFNVLRNRELPTTWNGYKVVDGDVTDYRPADCKGCVVGLRFKVTADQDVNEMAKNSPFVVDPESSECQLDTTPALPF